MMWDGKKSTSRKIFNQACLLESAMIMIIRSDPYYYCTILGITNDQRKTTWNVSSDIEFYSNVELIDNMLYSSLLNDKHH